MPLSKEQIDNAKYLKSAIAQLYSENENIILGLTGRTGSGCTTVASLLATNRAELHHNLFCGVNPATSEQRKEQIVRRYFEMSWVPFHCIQVSAIITTFLLDLDSEGLTAGLTQILGANHDIPKCLVVIQALARRFDTVRHQTNRDAVTAFYCDELPRQTGLMRTYLGERSFVHLYQALGKNLRLSGSPFSAALTDGQSLTIAKRIEEVIETLRSGKPKIALRIVVDAIRNPLEALYFQNRHADFLLLAVTAPDGERRGRLAGKNLTDVEIATIDKAEYTAHEAEKPDYYSVQDIQACLQRADLYVSNPDVPSYVEKYQGLAAQLIKFVALVNRPGIISTCSPGPVVTWKAGVWYSPRMRREPHALALQPGFYDRATGAGPFPTGSAHRLQSLARFANVLVGALRDGTGAFVGRRAGIVTRCRLYNGKCTRGSTPQSLTISRIV